MSANSKNWYDIQQWIYKVINSCETISQLLSAKKLVGLFEKQYPYKEFGDFEYIEYQCLINWWYVKYDQIQQQQ